MSVTRSYHHQNAKCMWQFWQTSYGGLFNTYPTRVDSSLVFAIWLTGNPFGTLFHQIDTNCFPFCRFDMSEVDLCGQCTVGWKCFRFDSIRSNQLESYESTEESTTFKNEEGSYIFISRILTSGGLCRVGWKCCLENLTLFEQIDTNRFPCCWFVMPEVNLCETRFRANWVKS